MRQPAYGDRDFAPVFPSEAIDDDEGSIRYAGMRLLDAFAMTASHAILSRYGRDYSNLTTAEEWAEKVAKESYMIAKAMLNVSKES